MFPVLLKRILICLCMALIGGHEDVHADEVVWGQFRGSGGSGQIGKSSVPIHPTEKNLAWKVPVPAGLSSPVIAHGKVYLTGVEEGRLVTLAYSVDSGELNWKKQAPAVELEKGFIRQAVPAASTPLADESGIYVYFGSFGLISYDQKGNERWKKEIETPKSLYGMSTSPIAYGENLILVLDNDNNLPDSKVSKSKVVAFDRATGDIAWETPRPFHRSGWSTPAIWKHDGGDELVILGNSRVTGYNAKTGEEKWYATGFSRETIAMPMVGNGHVYASASMLGGVPDENPDPEPFWKGGDAI